MSRMPLAAVVMVILAFTNAVWGQIPIPKREVGYVYKGGHSDAPVHLDFYMDIVCPDSQTAFPTMLEVANFYGPEKLQLKSHLFPLPYHRASFYATKGLHVVSMTTKGNQSYPWIELIFDNLDFLSNEAIRSWSHDQLVTELSKLAQKLGVSSSEFVQNINNNPDMEEDTRVAWKYACTRGVAATPTFMVNDVQVMAESTWSVDQWKTLIGPLLDQRPARLPLKEGPVVRTCPKHTKVCEYLPGKVECCTKGENCIPNVGCRC